MELKFKRIEPKAKPKLEVVPIRNGRTLEDYEIIAEENAVELSIKYYKRIPPVGGTLGFLFRDIEGGNRAVYEYVKSVLPISKYTGNGGKTGNVRENKAKKILILWKAMDEHSQNRVDVFDWLCDRFDLERQEFWAFAAKGMFNHYDAISQRVLMETKPEVIHNVRQFARREENFKDRELAAKATGLTKDAPLIGNIDASTKVNNNLSFTSGFNLMLKEADAAVGEIIEGEIVEERKQLSEGNTEFLNTEIKEESEEELLKVLRK